MAAPTPDSIRTKLEAIAQKGGPNGDQAKRLLSQLASNPEIFNDGNWQNQVDQSLVYDVGIPGDKATGGGAGKKLLANIEANNAEHESETFYDENDQLIKDYLDERAAAGEENTRWVDENVTPRLGKLDDAIGVAEFGNSAALSFLNKAREESKGELDNIAGEARESADRFNEMSGDAWDRYAGEQRGLNDADRAAESRYISETDPLMSLLQARGYVGDVTADAEGLGLQRDASNFAKGVGSGSLDYRSQAAQAYADPAAVAAQREGIGFLRDDVMTGDKDQREVMGEFKKLSDPSVTAKERLMYELTRRQFESEDRGNREAQSAALAAKGLRSGAASIAANQAARSQLAQDRMLGELGILASAQERADRNRAQWADQANQLRSSGQAARGMYGDATSELRGQTFDEAYGRGTAADAASANNQQTRMAGGQLQGNMANQMRADADALAMNNQREKGIAERFQDEYAAQERERVGNLASDRQRVSADTNKSIGDRYTNVYDAEQDMLDTNYGREEDARGYAWDASTEGYDMDKDFADTSMEVSDKYVDRAATGIDAATNVGQTRAGIRTDAMDDKERVLNMLLGNRSAGRGERVVRNG